MRLACTDPKSANCLPEELELLNEIAALSARWPTRAEDAVDRRRRLRDCRLRLEILLAQYRSREKL